MKNREKEMTINEVAEDLETSAYAVLGLIRGGRLKAYRNGKHWRVLPRHLEEYKREK